MWGKSQRRLQRFISSAMIVSSPHDASFPMDHDVTRWVLTQSALPGALSRDWLVNGLRGKSPMSGFHTVMIVISTFFKLHEETRFQHASSSLLYPRQCKMCTLLTKSMTPMLPSQEHVSSRTLCIKRATSSSASNKSIHRYDCEHVPSRYTNV